MLLRTTLRLARVATPLATPRPLLPFLSRPLPASAAACKAGKAHPGAVQRDKKKGISKEERKKLPTVNAWYDMNVRQVSNLVYRKTLDSFFVS